MPWRQEEEEAITSKKSLNIGFYQSDGVVRLTHLMRFLI